MPAIRTLANDLLSPWRRSAGERASYPLQNAFRLAAVLLVVLFHLSQATGNWLVIGNAGTDASFVLSGFTIWTLAARHRAGATDFFLRRVSRIAPLYWAETFLFTSIVTVEAHVQGTPGYATGHVLQSLFLLPHLDDRGTIFPVVNVAWSLLVESLFYALVALSFTLPRPSRLPLLLAVLLSLSTYRLFVAPTTGIEIAYTSNHMAEIAAGVLLAHLRLERRVLSPEAARIWIACGLLILAGEQLLHISPYASRWSYAGIPALMILAGAIGVEAARKPTSATALLALLGSATYPMYLFHGLVLRLVRCCTQVPIAVQAAALVILTLLLGLAIQPLDTWLTTRLRAGWRRRADVIDPAQTRLINVR